MLTQQKKIKGTFGKLYLPLDSQNVLNGGRNPLNRFYIHPPEKLPFKKMQKLNHLLTQTVGQQNQISYGNQVTYIDGCQGLSR